MHAAQLPYRPCVGIILVNSDGHVFAGRRIDTTEEAWQLPQGGIDNNEDPREAAFRELREEIGTDNATIVAESEDWLTYDLPDHLLGKVWQGRFRGQQQKWFVMRFEGRDREIHLDAHDPEFEDWQWLPFEELPKRIVKFKRPVYRQLVDKFADLVAGLAIQGEAERVNPE